MDLMDSTKVLGINYRVLLVVFAGPHGPPWARDPGIGLE
jgi:hypothetical protein